MRFQPQITTAQSDLVLIPLSGHDTCHCEDRQSQFSTSTLLFLTCLWLQFLVPFRSRKRKSTTTRTLLLAGIHYSGAIDRLQIYLSAYRCLCLLYEYYFFGCAGPAHRLANQPAPFEQKAWATHPLRNCLASTLDIPNYQKSFPNDLRHSYVRPSFRHGPGWPAFDD